jgi:predicted nuclease with TOPRIM domain
MTFNFLSQGAPDIAALLKSEHQYFSSTLTRLVAAAGETRDAAGRVLELCRRHFVLEESSYYPLLTRLQAAVNAGGIEQHAHAIEKEMARVSRIYSRIDRQHEAIRDALDALFDRVRIAENGEMTRLARMIRSHEQIERQLYWDAQQAVIVMKGCAAPANGL